MVMVMIIIILQHNLLQGLSTSIRVVVSPISCPSLGIIHHHDGDNHEWGDYDYFKNGDFGNSDGDD